MPMIWPRDCYTMGAMTRLATTFDFWQRTAEMGFDAWWTCLQNRLGALSTQQRRAAIAHEERRELVQAAFMAASAGPFQGLPVWWKDLFDWSGRPTTASSTFLADERGIPQMNAQLLGQVHAMGAIGVGKTHLQEFAYGLSGENPHYGNCQHPHFTDRVSGGSSSGSAVVVASGIAPLAFGTDTGGSIRVPAAYCGLWGIRTTPGWKQAGLFPLAPSFDTVGWLTSSAHDLASSLVLLEASPEPVQRGLLALPQNFPHRLATESALAPLPIASDAMATKLLERLDTALMAFNVLQSTEAYQVHERWLETHASDYDPNVLKLILRARQWTEEQHASARATQAELRAVFAEIFATYDFLVLPATPGPAPTREGLSFELRQAHLRLTTPVSLVGLPAITLPFPLEGGLTGGLQMVCPSDHTGRFHGLLKILEEQNN